MSLLLRNVLFTLLQPGIVAGLVPYLIASATGDLSRASDRSLLDIIAAGVLVAGLCIVLACIYRFMAEGKGTLSPLDPTRHLVASGLYRYSRNPMYVGVMLVLFGEAILFRSFWLAVYSMSVFTAFNLFIVFHEEPRLRRDFGEEYGEYTRRVRRWL